MFAIVLPICLVIATVAAVVWFLKYLLMDPDFMREYQPNYGARASVAAAIAIVTLALWIWSLA